LSRNKFFFYDYFAYFKTRLTHSLSCHFTLSAIPGMTWILAVCLLQCQCTADLHLLNDEYTCDSLVAPKLHIN